MGQARGRQKEIVFRTHGGKRRGAGRRPAGARARVSHASRAALSGREPVLVTLKMREHVWNLRTRRVFSLLLPTLLAAAERLGMRIAQFSVQRDHVHLLVEAENAAALARGVGGLCVRIAKRLNALMARTGKVFRDRFHSRVLRTPRAVRTAIAYVLCNFRKHGAAPSERGSLDPFSSASAFDGWAGGHALASTRGPSPPVAAPRTWLLSVGWRRAGATIDPDHRPGVLAI